jgi:hypothetical protein
MEMANLAEALRLASSALQDGTGAPWITTECGLILTPSVLVMLIGAVIEGYAEADPEVR